MIVDTRSGPNWLQLEAIDRLEDEYDLVQVGNYFPATRAVYVTALNDGRPRARFRVDDDGRCVPERIWS